MLCNIACGYHSTKNWYGRATFGNVTLLGANTLQRTGMVGSAKHNIVRPSEVDAKKPAEAGLVI